MTRCSNGHRAYDPDLWPSGCPDCMPIDSRPHHGGIGKDRTVVEAAAQKTGAAGTVVMRGQRLVGWLVVLSGPQRNTDFRLIEGDNRIGRAPGKDLQVPLDDLNVSNMHASLTYEAGTYEIIDLRSTNGTLINEEGKRIVRQQLRSGDVIHVGDTSLKFVAYE